MAKFKINHNENYSIISNCIFKDKHLSWKAKGILSTMLSLPDNWDYSLAGLEILANDGMSATRTALKELEEYGYLIRRPIRENGRIKDWEYVIFEEPQEENQVLEKPHVENLKVENQTQLNNNNININKLNNKENKELNNKENIYKEIIDYLNSKANTKYKYSSEKTKRVIHARLNEGFTLDDFKKVIDIKSSQWLGTDWEQYLRPETLFGTKFESYLNTKANKQQKSEFSYVAKAFDCETRDVPELTEEERNNINF